MADDFCKEFAKVQKKYMIEGRIISIGTSPTGWAMWKSLLFWTCSIRDVSDVSSIITRSMFASIWRTFFPNVCPITAFVKLEKESLLQLTVFIKEVLPGTCTGISLWIPPRCVYAGANAFSYTRLSKVLQNMKMFHRMVFRFQTIPNYDNKGEILNFMFTPENVDDRESLKQEKFLKDIKEKQLTMSWRTLHGLNTPGTVLQ